MIKLLIIAFLWGFSMWICMRYADAWISGLSTAILGQNSKLSEMEQKIDDLELRINDLEPHEDDYE